MPCRSFATLCLMTCLLSCFSACSSKSKKAEKLTLTPEGEKVRMEENWSALVGCRLISEIKVHTNDSEDGMVLLRNTAATKGAEVLTDLEWGRVQHQGETKLLTKAEAYKCH